MTLGLRIRRLGEAGEENRAEVITKAIITALRNGQLYYYYTYKIPADGRGAGAYGPTNHMYPFTPVELRPGWMVGKERTIACVSGVYKWNREEEPACYLFDRKGRGKPNSFRIAKRIDCYEVEVKINDWNEIAVIEERE